MKTIKINFVAAFVLILYPIIIFLLGYIYWRKFGIGTFEIVSMIVAFYVYCISVGVGIHRLWAHGSYKANKFVEVILAIVSAGTLQGPILAWVSDHDKHHSYTDILGKDPHTPLKYCILEEGMNEYSTKNKLKGFVWSHIGWMLSISNNKKLIERSTLKRLGKNKIVVWQFKNYWKIAILVNTVIPFCIGYLIGQNIQYAVAGFIFIGIGRAIQQQATFCINSVVHFFGDKKYTNGTAGDIPILFFMFLGENWHNFHHAFPRDYRNGHKWYQLDIHKWIIAFMEKLGLATNLIRTPKERIVAKVQLTQKQFMLNMTNRLDNANMRLNLLLNSLIKEMGIQPNKQLALLKEKALRLKKIINDLISISNSITQEEVVQVLSHLQRLESNFSKCKKIL